MGHCLYWPIRCMGHPPISRLVVHCTITSPRRSSSSVLAWSKNNKHTFTRSRDLDDSRIQRLGGIRLRSRPGLINQFHPLRQYHHHTAKMSLQFTPTPTTPGQQTQRPSNPRQDSIQSFTPAFPSDFAMTSGNTGGYGSQPGSRRPSMHGGHPGLIHPFPVSLSRRSSLASGPRPLTKAEFSGPNTPSLLSRAGSPVQPLASEGTRSRQNSFSGRDKRHGQFIGSLDCGTT